MRFLRRFHEPSRRTGAASRVLLVNHAAEFGGAEYGLIDIARHYGPERCHVVLFADGPVRHRLEASGIGVTVMEGGTGVMGMRREAGRLRALRAVPALVGMVLRLARISRDYDVLYLNSQKAAIVGLLAAPLARRRAVWHLHDILSAEHFAWAQRRCVVTLANRFATKTIAISGVSRDSLIACGADPRRIAVVPNGIDTSRFEPLDAEAALALRNKLGLSGVTLVGLFGRITPWKGQHVLIRALAGLPGVHAIIVGDALFGEQAYKAGLIEQARQLGVADRLHWLGFRHDTPQLMQIVDVVVHTSVAPEPFGRVIVEGVMAGRPVVASNHGASVELLGTDYRWLVPADDAGALLRAIDDVLALPAGELARCTALARVRAMRLFTLPQMLQGIVREVGLPA